MGSRVADPVSSKFWQTPLLLCWYLRLEASKALLALQLIVGTARLQLRIIIGMCSVVKIETKPGVVMILVYFLPNSQQLGDKSDMFGAYGCSIALHISLHAYSTVTGCCYCHFIL